MNGLSCLSEVPLHSVFGSINSVEVAAYYDMGLVEFLGHFVVFFVLCLSSGGVQGHVTCDYAELLAVDWYVQACASAWDNHIELGV